MRILLAEDDLMIGGSLCKGLRGEGFTVDWIQDGRSAELALETTSYALVPVSYTHLDVYKRQALQ